MSTHSYKGSTGRFTAYINYLQDWTVGLSLFHQNNQEMGLTSPRADWAFTPDSIYLQNWAVGIG